MIKYFIGFVFLLVTVFAGAQDMQDDAYFDTEGLLLDRFAILTSDTVTNEIKDKESSEISRILSEFLAKPESMEEEFELKNLGKVSSSDGKMNIYTWNYQHRNYSYHYGGVVQYFSSPNANPIVFELKHQLDKVPTDKTDQNNWYGCLYYKILANEYKGNTTYTVFGWDGYNAIITRKVIDVFTVNRNGVFIGKPIFYMEKGRAYRMLFQYNSQTVMMLDYDESKGRIIFDHLSPSSPEDKGDYRMYGPDSTYDALEFKKGKWYLSKDVDLRLKRKEGKLGKPKKYKKVKQNKRR